MKKKMSIFKFNPPQILAIGFLGLIALGTLLLMLPISTYKGYLPFIDALFTATSAVCVTGLVVTDTATTFTPFGQIIIMLLIQIGGLGVMTFGFFVAILLGKQINLRDRLLLQNTLNKISLAGMVKLVKWIVIVTVIVEGIGALLLALSWSEEKGWGSALYYGVFHSISAFNNAGFDLMGNFRSLTGYVGNVPINLIISSLLIIGGIGYLVLADIYQNRRFGRWSLHTKLVVITTLIMNAAATLFIFLFEYDNPGTLGTLPLSDQILASYFQAVAPRTAGFNSVDLSKLMEDSQALIMGLMFVGAAPGSTGGGIKITTFVIMLLVVWNFVIGKEEMNIMRRRIPDELIFRVLSITVIAVFFIFLSILILNVTEPTAPFKIVTFEVISAFGTVGLSLGLTPHLSLMGKIVIIIMMFIGRLGPLTIAFALTKRAARQKVRYPEEKILIG